MCGIAGWVDWQRDLTQDRGTAQAMTDSMKCRGPDAEGLWLTESRPGPPSPRSHRHRGRDAADVH